LVGWQLFWDVTNAFGLLSELPMRAELPEHVIVQRVAVRMLHDERFRAAVYAKPEEVLAGLSKAARDMLVAADFRAWGVDVHRPTRVLKAILDEYPVSALALLEEGQSLQGLHAFFSSAKFHEAVMRREALAPGFGDFLATLAKGATSRAVVSLESAIARVRRREVPSNAEGDWLVRGTCEALSVKARTLVVWEKARAALSEGDPVARLLSGKRLPRLGKVEKATEEHLLVSRETEGEPTVGFVGEGLVRLLQLAEHPVPREVLQRAALEVGADEGEVDEIVNEIEHEGLLKRSAAGKK